MLGPPEIERDGVVVAPPRGHKAWGVLAYVVLAERPVARTRLAGLVFADADDPRGALRWTLAQADVCWWRFQPASPTCNSGSTIWRWHGA